MRGTVFSIEEFSVYDGPGIRTTVFLKGCPLRCTWCHNPEGQRCEPEIVRASGGCLGCGRCEAAAELKNGEIAYTEKSIVSCPRGLLRVSGIEYESVELVEKLMKNERILNTGGGVTFSGGEPFAQSDFLLECLGRLRGRLHTAVQTSGFASRDAFIRATEITDYFLFDLKIADPVMHESFTGVKNGVIMKNLELLIASGCRFVIRIPLIPEVTDTEENLTELAKILKKGEIDYAELLPYNKMAGSKYKMLGRVYKPNFDELREPARREALFLDYGIKTKIL